MDFPTFPTAQELIYERLLSFSPRKFDQTHHYLNGNVSLFSPYLTHGFLTLPMIRKAVEGQYGERAGFRLMFELAWREFLMRVFWKYGEKALWLPLENKKTNIEYEKFMPENLLKYQTGIKVLDQQLASLVESGYMHKQARQWLACYLTHYTATDWRLGARWFFYHQLDGELACNNLSWQMISGNFAEKPYLFNQEMLNPYVPEELRENGNAIDLSMEEIEEKFLVQHRFLLADNLRMPLELKTDFDAIATDLTSEEQILNEVKNCNELIYIHEWMINEFQISEFDNAGNCYRLMIIDREFWQKNPVSSKRLKFMVDLAKNIPNVRIYLGNPIELLKKIAKERGEERDILKIYSQEYFTDRIKEIFTSLYCAIKIDLEVWPYPWLFPTMTTVPNRFTKFFALVERVL